MRKELSCRNDHAGSRRCRIMQESDGKRAMAESDGKRDDDDDMLEGMERLL
jgi:hypothetical protein